MTQSKFLTWHIKGAVRLVSTLGLPTVCDPSLQTQYKSSPWCKLQQALEMASPASCRLQPASVATIWVGARHSLTHRIPAGFEACLHADCKQECGQTAWELGMAGSLAWGCPFPSPAHSVVLHDMYCLIVLAGLGCILCSSIMIKAVHQ